jgi:hypothetical protein
MSLISKRSRRFNPEKYATTARESFPLPRTFYRLLYRFQSSRGAAEWRIVQSFTGAGMTSLQYLQVRNSLLSKKCLYAFETGSRA